MPFSSQGRAWSFNRVICLSAGSGGLEEAGDSRLSSAVTNTSPSHIIGTAVSLSWPCPEPYRLSKAGCSTTSGH